MQARIDRHVAIQRMRSCGMETPGEKGLVTEELDEADEAITFRNILNGATQGDGGSSSTGFATPSVDPQVLHPGAVGSDELALARNLNSSFSIFALTRSSAPSPPSSAVEPMALASMASS